MELIKLNCTLQTTAIVLRDLQLSLQIFLMKIIFAKIIEKQEMHRNSFQNTMRMNDDNPSNFLRTDNMIWVPTIKYVELQIKRQATDAMQTIIVKSWR